MVKHIVLYTLKEGVNKDDAVAVIASVLEPLVGKISEFESREALDNYAKHPLHEEAKSHFFHLLDSRVAADYEV